MVFLESDLGLSSNSGPIRVFPRMARSGRLVLVAVFPEFHTPLDLLVPFRFRLSPLPGPFFSPPGS